ncbi:sensory rhodopsin transducer [Jannaschia formosa]|uniref:sensory rhodopsin transducer n=1 Tax=Jannaschia formosa TaxID=2259592 RepID=UPI000E1B7CA3|nr:sensory rhodopsin transducer [Jannaschia formosa]TFL18365.1 sensory rhodopsin transducer [Jannaschia formosa]
MVEIGSRRWVIAEGFIPSRGIEGDRALESHEAFCLLNAGDSPAHLEITLYFADRPPVGPYRATVPAQRTLHLRANDLDDPEPVPRDTDYAVLIQSDAPVVVQHTRLDSRPERFALLSAAAHPVG